MNTRGLNHHTVSTLLIASAIFTLLLSACQPAGTATSLPTAQPTAVTLPAELPTVTQPPIATPAAQPTQTPPQATEPPSGTSGEITLDLSGVAQDQTVETIAAVAESAGGPNWEAMPQYRRVTLQGYPVTSHLMKPQIFVYPVAELAGYNKTAGQIAIDLQALLQTKQAGNQIPILPLFNAQQVMHAQVQYLDFKNGKGVRFLTQYDQAFLPINNYELVYTYQGLTSDGKYYIAAILPVTHPELPDTQQVSAQQAAELNDFPTYLTKTVTWLDQQAVGSFNPDLAKLDDMVQSIDVK
ncbi:MAG: hypothetical protein M1281_14865 [Chloroflexi bacterium]|nr:hypothetical protein [Chloroflexota bacterium]